MEFSLEHCQGFADFAMEGDGFFQESEKQRIVLDALNNIRAHEDGTVPGFPEVKIYKNRTIGKLTLILLKTVKKIKEKKICFLFIKIN